MTGHRNFRHHKMNKNHKIRSLNHSCYMIVHSERRVRTTIYIKINPYLHNQVKAKKKRKNAVDQNAATM